MNFWQSYAIQLDRTPKNQTNPFQSDQCPQLSSIFVFSDVFPNPCQPTIK